MIKPYYQDEHSTIFLGDCKTILPQLEKVDLVLTDPPYGIGEAAGKNKSRGNLAIAKDYGFSNWDKTTIPQGLIDELISKSPSIIFGGNYYEMPASQCWLIWDKNNGSNDFADAEMAWTNLSGSVRLIKYTWNGMLKQLPEQRDHPTQKPLTVMRWCIEQADIKQKKEHKTILDPFMGSGTTLLAAKNLGRKAIGIELEEKYCEIAVKRLRQQVLNLG